MKPYFFLLLVLLSCTACGDQKIDTTKARQEMEARAIIRVSDGEIVEKALNWGNELSGEIQFILSDGLTEEDNFEEQTIGLYSAEDIPFHYQFVSFQEIGQFSGKKFEVFDAFQYASENNLVPEPSVQILEGDTLILYSKPIFDINIPGVFFIEFPKKDIVLAIRK